MPLIAEESSTLDSFENSLTKEKPRSSQSSNNNSSNNSSSNNNSSNSCSIHTHYNSYCNRCCDHKNNPLDNIDLFFKISKSLVEFSGLFVKGAFYLISSPVWVIQDIADDASVKGYDEYPFYSSEGMYKAESDKWKYFNTELSSFSFDDDVYGSKVKLKINAARHGFSYSRIDLKEEFNSEVIKKRMNHLMYSNTFAINNKFFNKHSIDFSYGIGLSNWKSDSYKDSGLRLEYSINAFIKPFSLRIDLGHSNVGNGIYDMAASISCHIKRLSFTLGQQKFRTYESAEIKGKSLSVGLWF